MLAVGSIQPLISEKVSKCQLQFDIPRFLTEVVLPALDTSGKWQNTRDKKGVIPSNICQAASVEY